jgi:very-short-patch-repair endonuclease
VYDDLAIHLSERRHGVVATWELLEHGVSADHVRRLGESRHWDRPTRRVLRRTGSASTEGQTLAIALLDAGPHAFLSHVSSGSWWGLPGCALKPCHAVTTSTSRRRPELVTLHRVRRLPPCWTTEHSGIPIVRPELCALQMFAVCPYEVAERRTEALWSDRLLSGRSLRRFLHDMGRSGRNGTAGVRQYLDARPDDYTPPATGLESRVDQILKRAGVEVRRQVDTGSDDAWTGRVDFLVVGTAVVVEVQSQKHHRALVDREADADRRARLEAAGFIWVEVWDTDVWTAPHVVESAVRDGIRRYRARTRAS